MSKFFINRPIVAIVISVLTVIVGGISTRVLPGFVISGNRHPPDRDHR